MKLKKWIKRHFTLYNLSIIVLIAIIAVSLVIVFMPPKEENDDSTNKTNNVENTNTKNTENTPKTQTTNSNDNNTSKPSVDNITEEQAREIAVNKCKELGETIEAKDLNVSSIERNGEKSYYISSKENTMEISKSTGKIIRLNSVAMD